MTILDTRDVLTQSRSEDLGQTAVELIDADVDTAVVRDTGTGAQAVLFVPDLAIDLAVSRRIGGGILDIVAAALITTKEFAR